MQTLLHYLLGFRKTFLSYLGISAESKQMRKNQQGGVRIHQCFLGISPLLEWRWGITQNGTTAQWPERDSLYPGWWALERGVWRLTEVRKTMSRPLPKSGGGRALSQRSVIPTEHPPGPNQSWDSFSCPQRLETDISSGWIKTNLFWQIEMFLMRKCCVLESLTLCQREVKGP